MRSLVRKNRERTYKEAVKIIRAAFGEAYADLDGKNDAETIRGYSKEDLKLAKLIAKATEARLLQTPSNAQIVERLVSDILRRTLQMNYDAIDDCYRKRTWGINFTQGVKDQVRLFINGVKVKL